MSEWAARRFWKAAEAVPATGGFGLRLDGRAVRTPARAELIVPTRALAEAAAAEWQAQGERVDPLSMPVTRSANAAIDKVAPQRDAVAGMLAEYGDSDLLCYRAEAPAGLVERQAESWDPLLDWAAREMGARLHLRRGVMHRPQPPEALAALAARLEGLDAFELTALHDLVSLTGSLVLGLAAMRGLRPLEELWALSRIDETWQQEQWGVDEEAARVAAFKRGEFLHAGRFNALRQAP